MTANLAPTRERSVEENASTCSSPSAAGPRPWRRLLHEMARDWVSLAVFAVSVVAVGFLYSLLLPFAYTQQFSFTNWQYLNARYVMFSCGFALGMSWVVTLQVYSLRQVAKGSSRSVRVDQSPSRSGPIGWVAALVSFLPSLLCCSPIVPSLVGLLPLSVATRLQTTGKVTHLFATKENWILIGALVILVASGVWSLRKTAASRCAVDGCSEVGCR
jgi:hypothetical protein